MQFPMYPEPHRKLAKGTLKVCRIFLALDIAGILALVLAFAFRNGALLFGGLLVLYVFGMLYFGTRHALNAMVMVEIGENEIRIVDNKGDVLRSAEYRYVRDMEARELEITLIADEGNRGDPGSGISAKLILVYINGAFSFDDLKLRKLGKGNHIFYYCDKLFFHQNCIALDYNEEAWNLLQERVYRLEGK